MILRFLWPVLKPYAWYYMGMLLVPFLAGFYAPITSYALKLLIDTVSSVPNFTYQDLKLPISLFILTQVGNDIIWRISDILERKAEPYLNRDILLAAYNHVQHQSPAFFQSSMAGSLTSKIKDISTGYDRLWGEFHYDTSPRFFGIVMGITSFLLVSPSLAATLLLWAVALLLTMRKLTALLNQYTKEASEEQHRLIGAIADRINNILPIILFSGRKRAYQDIYKQATHTLIPKELRVYTCDLISSLVGSLFYWAILIVVFYMVIRDKQQGRISTGDLAFLLSSTFHLVEEVWHLIMKWREFSVLIGELSSALSIVTPAYPPAALPSARITPEDSSIRFANISFGYTDAPLLDNFTLHIQRGEKLALVGPSGSGKSTLINLLLGCLSPQAGHIYFGQQPTDTLHPDSLFAHISLVPQDVQLFHTSILDNIRYGKPDATLEEVEHSAKRAHIHQEILALAQGYHTTVGERGTKLSLGQRQRIAIARAFLRKTPVLILDEATSCLDSHTEHLIQASLQEIFTDTSQTVIAVAHRLSTIQNMDRIIVLEKGKIIEEGTHQELIHKPHGKYKHLWQFQKI